jgi:hypothetical protein
MGGIETFGVISICLFFLVFLAALIYAATQRTSFCRRMSALPLNDGASANEGKEANRAD